MRAGVYGAEGSGWHEAYQAGKPTLDRAQAMLADLIGRRGPDEYTQALIHIVPQSFGLVHVGGGSIERLSAVGAMEELDDAWREVQSLMAIDSPTATAGVTNQIGQPLAEAAQAPLGRPRRARPARPGGRTR